MSLSPCSGNSPTMDRKISLPVACRAIDGKYYPVNVPSFERSNQNKKRSPFEKALRKWKPWIPLEPGKKYLLDLKRTFICDNGIFQFQGSHMLNIVAVWKSCILILYKDAPIVDVNTPLKKLKIDANAEEKLEPIEIASKSQSNATETNSKSQSNATETDSKSQSNATEIASKSQSNATETASKSQSNFISKTTDIKSERKVTLNLEPCDKNQLICTKGYARFRIDKVKQSHKCIYFKDEIPSLFENFSAGMTMVAKKIIDPKESSRLKENAYYVSQWYVNESEKGFRWRCLKCSRSFQTEASFCFHTKTKMSYKNKLDEWKEVFIDNGKATIEGRANLRISRPFKRHVSYTINDPSTFGNQKGCWGSLQRGCEKWNSHKPMSRTIQNMRSHFLKNNPVSESACKYFIYIYILDNVKTSRISKGWYDDEQFKDAPRFSTESDFYLAMRRNTFSKVRVFT